MANLKEIRNRIRSVITTQQMTRAMKMVSAAKLRRAQDRIIKLRPYAGKLKEVITNLTADLSGDFSSPYVKVRPSEKVLLVIVTSNRGLCGAFNANVIKLALKVIEENYSEQRAKGNLQLLCIGKKGYEFFSRRKYNLVGGNNDLLSKISFADAKVLCESVMQGFISKKWDKVDLIYNEFKNVITQIRIWEPFLPLKPIAAEKGKKVNTDSIFEPGKMEILESVIPQNLKIQFFKAVIESNAGEQGARMSAMDSATNNADELLKALKLNYNRERQASITKELLEIVAGADALAAK